VWILLTLVGRLPCVCIVTRWSEPGGIEACFIVQLVAVNALTLSVGSSRVEFVPEMTRKVSCGTLSLYSLTFSSGVVSHAGFRT